MHCTACGHENRPGRKFCGECGAALALSCRACGTANEPGEKFCGECGAALGSEAPARSPAASAGRAPEADVRKVVTIVFADLVGSTALHERLDPESVRRVMDRYYAALRTVVDEHGGTVVKLLGDGVMAAFGLKRVAEDDALRAVRAAAAMQEAFRALVATHEAALGAAGLRVAVNTGEVVVTAAQDDVLGDPVNVAARLQEQGSDGDVVVGEATRRLVATRVTLAPLGSVALKGRAEAVAAHRLVSLEPPAGAAAAPFVGREAELARLERVRAAALDGPATRLAVLVGSPGLGKSRLIDEVARRHADEATILAAHCDAAGGATFAPLAQALRRFLGLADAATGEAVRTAVAAVLGGGDDDGERARIARGIDGLIAGSAMSPEETFFVVRRFLAGLAAAQPVVLVIDDLHWGEPLLLDLVEHLVQWGSGVPLFVLVGARPELRELRSSLVTTGGVVADAVVLGGLDAGAAMRLAAGVIGAADLPAAVAAKVLATSEGNPLFVGELVRMLVQEGALAKEGDRWTVGANLAALEMPPTIHALLAARIERLGSEDRTVLERAAVVGRHFSRSAVAALLGKNGSELDARLESLRRSELIERDTGWLLGEPVMRFHHVLIRDAAYRRLLKGTRAELHARLADWIEGQVGDAAEHDEMIGWHLEQAHQLLRELGPVDAAGAALGERAARRLAAAGRRALARDDVSLAAGLLGRAVEQLGAGRRDAMPCVDGARPASAGRRDAMPCVDGARPASAGRRDAMPCVDGARPASADAPERADLVLDWCEALLAAGDVGPAADAIAELARIAAAAPDGSARLHAWHTCFAGQLTVLTAPEALHATADRVGAAARELAALADAAGEAKAHFVHAQALARLGKIGACEAALDQALAAARRAGDRRRANAVLAGAPLAALWGPSPVTRASGRCLDVVRVLRITQGAPAVEAVALSCQGVLEALRGRTEAARRMLSSSRTMVEELGISHRLYETEVFAGRIDLLEGDAPAAERALRAGYDGLRELGLGIDAARAAALLGRALLAQDRAAEAETLSHESELLAGDDLQAAIAWRGVRAEALARRGDHAAAIGFAEAAVVIAAATDALLDHADARLALAAAFRAGGRRAEADAEERRAFELWEAKGATVLAERARRTRPADPAPAVVPNGRAGASRSTARRVHANEASALAARFEAAFAAGDGDAVAVLWADALEVVDHVNGAAYDRDGHLASIRRLQRARDPRMRFELLAVLGSSLCLTRRRIASQGTSGGRFDVGASEYEALVLFEVDERGAGRRIEIFSADHLGEAIARLYERYAETLSDGPSRAPAAVAARAVAYVLTTADVPELSLVYAATYEDVDHRTVGYGHVSGDALGKLDQSLQALADDLRFRIDDVLALEPHGFVRTTTSSGTWREGGGAFERTVCTLTVLGPDGRITNHETFDADREAEALARFDALTRSEQPKAVEQRRVRPNAVTRAAAEFERIVVARDVAALETFFAEDAECLDHPHGATYGAEGMRAGMRRLMQAPDARLRHIPLATLGESWGLVRREMSASGAVGGRFDVGAYEIVDVAVFGTDERGRLRHVEIFAAERLGAGIVRLYERYAGALPDEAAASRARGTARALAVFDGAIDLDRIADAYASSFEAVDQRVLGTWSARGREDWLTQWREQFGLADASRCRYDAVLALEPGASLVHQTFAGIGRASGGDFEHVVLVLNLFDGEGRIARTEVFEPERADAALARFDALTAPAVSQPSEGRRGGSRRLLRANAATAAAARFDAAFAARDEAGLAALCADDLTVVDHPSGADYGRDGVLESYRRLLRMDGPTMRYEPLATLGESLALFRRRIRASGGRLDVGEYERDEIVVAETDAAGRFRHHETFATERLRAAIVRLYERYAASLREGPARTRPENVARALAAYDGPLDPARIASGHSPSFVCVDRRIFSTWSAEGREAWRKHWREQAELAAAFTPRDDDVLALDPGAHVLRTTFGGVGRASGGTIENVFISVSIHDADGLFTRLELFEPDQEVEALACFERLTADATPRPAVRRPVRPNAATRTFAAIEAAFGRRDLAAVDALLGDPLETIEHPTGTTYGREGQLESSRWMMRLPDLVFRVEPLATLGESICLARRFVSASGNTAGSRFEVGAYEIESLVVNAVDAAGRLTSAEVFAPDRLGPAIARLHARYAESLPPGPERTRAEGIARNYEFWNGMPDPEGFRSVLASAFECVDHRSLGTWAVVGADEWIRHWRAQAELAEGFRRRDDDLLAFTPAVHVLRQTFVGTNRASDGPFENVVVEVCVFDAEGRVVRAESYEPDEEAAALARFDELVAGEQPATPPRRRVRRNAAIETAERLFAAIVRRDGEAFGRELADDFELVHHPTAASYGRRGMLATWRSLFKAKHFAYDAVVLGTLGDALVLHRHALSAEGFAEEHLAAAGRIEMDEVVVDEVDAHGRFQHMELFAGERLGDAIACAYARHAERLPEGPARERAAMTARAVATMLTRSTEHRLEDVSTPDIAAVDHRAVAMGTVSGPDLWTRWRAASQRGDQHAFRVEDVLALGPDALLRRTTETGTVRASGGAFENGIWILSVFGPDGRQSRIELFDVGREAEALARFDALVGRADRAGAVEPMFANAATRALDRFAHVTAARDWEGLADLCAADLLFDDRRPLFAMQLPKAGFLAQHRVLFDVPNARWVMRPIATRGERLTLSQILLQGDVADGGGALEIDHRGVIEVDVDGRMTAIVLFEPADLDAAYTELDARDAAGEGARQPPVTSQFSRAIARRDWDAVAAMCGSGFAEHDHRSLALLGVSRDPETWVRNFRVQVDLAPDTVARFEHVRPCPRGSLWTLTWEGSRDGGRYEIPMVGVTELDGRGKLARVDLYDPEQLDQARARFAELAAPAPSAEPFANAASALVAQVMAAIVAHDWQRSAGLYADDFRMSDRRRVAQLELDRDQFVAFTREGADGRTVRATAELLATRGERLALTRPVYVFSDADVGPSEIAFLILTEADPRGRIAAQVRWDVEDIVAARSELDRRWRAVERVEHPRVAAFHVAFTRTLAARDWDGLAALLAPTLVAHDHRLVGWDVRHGPEAYVDVVRAMVDLAPDAEGRLDHARTCAHGFLGEVVWVGTRDGGAFESPFVWVVELDDTGRAQRFDFYDPHHLEGARARFAEIDRNAPQAALDCNAPQAALDCNAPRGGSSDACARLAKPTPATAAMGRWLAAYDAGFETGQWEAMRTLFASKYGFDDRRRMALLQGDIELMLASLRERAASGARTQWTLVGTAGERIAIGRMLWSGGPSDGRFEIEYLGVIEVNEAGFIVAHVLYDLADARAAQRDAWARWAAIEPAVAPWLEAAGALVDAFEAHDREGLVVPFADDVVVEDHRRTGFGRIEGASAYADAVAVLWELAPEHHLDHGRFWPVVERHGFVATHDRFGTLADGGVFESRGLSLCVVAGGRITRVELFELEDLDRARARLAELRPDPLRIPPNAATRTWDRWCDAVVAGSLDVVATLYHPSYRFDDRRALIRLTTDRAGVLANDRLLMEDGWRPARTLLATAGDRFALQRILWAVGEAGGRSEVEILQLSEVDGEGRFVAGTTFDPGDRAAASEELFERYAASGADGTKPAALDAIRAWNAHDLERFRALLPTDFYLHDHRRTGVGRLEGRDAYVDSLAALWELSRDIRLETLYSIAVTPHGRLWVCRWFGSNAEGGAFDAVYVCVGFHFDARGCLEIFELEDLELARARYAELSATPF